MSVGLILKQIRKLKNISQKDIAEILNVPTPTIDKILLWGQEMIGKQYMLAGRLNGKDLIHSGYVSPDLFHDLINK